MNKQNSASIFLFIFSFFIFVSCDNEPLDPILAAQINTPGTGGTGGGNTGGGAGGGSTSSVVGSYILTAFNTSVPTDLNGDGTPSTNQMSETSCFNNSLFIINSNNTFSATGGGIDIDLTTTPNVITCFTDPVTTGTWSLSGNQLTTNYIEAGIPYTDVFTVVGNTLILTYQDGEVVGTAGGNPVFLTADITAIYSKQ
jgi:hypothetical protein